MKTRAEDKGDHWLLQCAKTYISNGLISEHVRGGGLAQPGFDARGRPVRVEEACQGFKRGRKLKKLGLHSRHGRVVLPDVKVPRSQRAGRANPGLSQPDAQPRRERLTSAVGNVTRCRAAFEVTWYIIDRKAFGRPIGTFRELTLQDGRYARTNRTLLAWSTIASWSTWSAS